MKLFYILILLAFILSISFLQYLLKTFFVKKQKSSSKELTKNRMYSVIDKFDEAKPKFWDDYRNKTIAQLKHIPILGLTDTNRRYLELLIDAAEGDKEKKRTPEIVHFTQISYLTIYVLICVCLSLIWKYALVLLIFSYTAYKMPITVLKEKYEQDCQEIYFQFPPFYDSVYAQYSKKDASVLMYDVVEAYLPVSSGAFRRLLKRFLIDLEKGEEQALRKLDERYSSSVVIHKFCSIMRLRLKGDEASYLSMATFRDALNLEVKDWMMEDLEKRKQIATKVTTTMIVFILTIVMIIYFLTFLEMGLG